MAGQPEVFETPDVPILPTVNEPVQANAAVWHGPFWRLTASFPFRVAAAR